MRKDKQIIFGEFRFDDVNECLWRESQAITLRPKAFAVLKYLLERAGQLVSKQQLLDAVWPDTFVSDAVLKDSIRQLREALDDDVKSPQFIETAHRRGYRFIGQIPEDTARGFSGSEKSENYDVPFEAGFDVAHLNSEFFATGLVGREKEMSQMKNLFENMLRKDRQIIFVTGEPGIGKTTLVEAFLQELASYGNVRVARGQCLEQYGAGEAYLPVLEAISRLIRNPDKGRPSIELLTRYAPTWLIQIPSLMNAMGGSSEPARQELLAGAAQEERMLREMAEAVEAMTAVAPLVLVLEDLHWSDYSTLDLISYLARRREPAQLMVIGTYRPVDVLLSDHPLKGIKRELQMHRLCRELPVEYLNEEAVVEFLDKRFPNHQFSNELAFFIHHHTEGNPLFMINVVDYLLDEQIIVEQAGVWQLSGQMKEVKLDVPENIRHLIERQIERLSDEEQRILEAASVVGMDCSAIAISAGMGEDVIRIEEVCDKLARNHQFLLPAYLAELPDGTVTPRYKFIHVLYLNVLYKRVAHTRRARIHRQIGERGEQIYGTRVGEIAAELAVHFEQAQDWERAVKYLQIAAENASLRYAKHEALVLAERRLGLLHHLPEKQDHDFRESVSRTQIDSTK